MECPHLEDHVINIKSDLQKVFKAEKKWFCSGGWLVKVLLRHTRNTVQKYFGDGCNIRVIYIFVVMFDACGLHQSLNPIQTSFKETKFYGYTRTFIY